MPTANEIIEWSAGDCNWLVGNQAAKRIEAVQSALSDGLELTNILKGLRKEHSVARAEMLLQQAQLRDRAAKKFRLAQQMFFNEKGLQQSSGDLIAHYKSSKFGHHRSICDLCTGIGGDAMAFAQHAGVTGVELSRTTAFFANSNLSLVSTTHQMHCADVVEFSVKHFDAWHIDPDQRAAKRRSREPCQMVPGLNVIDRLLAENRNASIKLSPAAKLSEAWIAKHAPLEIEFVGDHRECKQQIIWSGDTITKSCRTATILQTDRPPVSVSCAESDDESLSEEAITLEPGILLYEPHATILAAGLAGLLARQHGLQKIDWDVDYLIGLDHVSDPALSAFEIVDSCAADQKLVRRMLKKHNASVEELKKRGVDHRLMESFRGLKKSGDEPHTLIITRTSEGRRVLLVRRRR